MLCYTRDRVRSEDALGARDVVATCPLDGLFDGDRERLERRLRSVGAVVSKSTSRRK